MKKMNFPVSAALFAAVLTTALPTRAAGHHDHAIHAHSTPDSTMEPSPSGFQDAMPSLYKHLGELEGALTARNVKEIHHHDVSIKALVKDLDKDSSLSEKQKKRVHAYTEKIAWLSAKIHAQAHEDKFTQAGKDFAELRKHVDLLDTQFPHSHKPSAAGKTDSNDAGHREGK